MQLKRKLLSQHLLGWSLLALSPALLWLVSRPSHQIEVSPAHFVYLHTAVELFAVVVAMLIFVTGYRAFLTARKGAVILLAIAFLGVGLLDFLHTVSYAARVEADTVKFTQQSLFFGLAARFLAAAALLGYALLPTFGDVSLSRKRLALALMLGIVGVLGWVGLVWPDRVPAFFIAGQGLTPLKAGFEWLIVVINLAAFAVLWQRHVALAHECVIALGFAVALSTVSELFFTLLGGVGRDGATVVGHFYKLVAHGFLFFATFSLALRRPLDRLEIQHLREKMVLLSAPDGVLWVNHDGEILMVNPSLESLTGYAPQELIGRNVDIFLPPHLRERHAQAMRRYFTEPHARAMGNADVQLMRCDGSILPVDICLGHWEDEGEQHVIAYVRDMTERKGYEATLRHQASHDKLTGLPNRWLFHLQLDQAMAQANRSGRRVAALFLDLDDFKAVNDSFGHLVGDELLVQVARRMRESLREQDILARLGGDEFAVLIADMAGHEEALNVSHKLLAALDAPYRLKEQQVQSGASIGLAFYPDDAQDSESLLRFADMAMYQAKRDGRGTFACYSAQLGRQASDSMQLHVRLKEAIRCGALKLFYQPQVDVRSGRIVGAEALLRWHDEVLGEVSPARFIPVAESTGLILPLSEWVLETACKQIALWDKAGSPVRVAVNFSAHQFRQQNVHEKVRDALKRTGARADLLEIEITESIAMQQLALARVQIDALVTLGCTIALDDFGTGYSSLAYLKSLPVTILKIDRGFIKDIPQDHGDAKISRSIIALAHSLDMTLVAEGVETEEQLEFLREHGCETYQGWLYAKALQACELTPRLQAHCSNELLALEDGA